jgi:hypothetical protein
MSTIGDFFKVLSMPCNEHALIISRTLDDPGGGDGVGGGLSKGTCWGLWVHERYCTGCRAYHRQLLMLRSAARKVFGWEPAPSPAPTGAAGGHPPHPPHSHGTGRAPCPHEVRERLVRAVAERGGRGGGTAR